MDAQINRSHAVLKVLGISLLANIALGSLKIFYGRSANSLAFMADGLHTYFDACATLLGMISIYLSAYNHSTILMNKRHDTFSFRIMLDAT